jgi:hypothetical protein
MKESIKNSDVSLIAWPKNILVIYRYDEIPDLRTLIDWASTLGVEVENVDFLSFTTKKAFENGSGVATFSPKSISWTGSVTDENLKSKVKKKYDILISFYETSSLELDYISHIVAAIYKVGLGSSARESSDLMIDVTLSQTDVFAAELNKYLTILTKK